MILNKVQAKRFYDICTIGTSRCTTEMTFHEQTIKCINFKEGDVLIVDANLPTNRYEKYRNIRKFYKEYGL